MKEETKRWWEKAQDDLEKARILFKNKKYDGTVFFCQQSIEKGLKAVMLKEKNTLKKIHDLVALGKEVALPSNLLEYCKEITSSYIYARYPDIEEQEDMEGIAKRFLIFSEEVLQWIRKKL